MEYSIHRMQKKVDCWNLVSDDLFLFGIVFPSVPRPSKRHIKNGVSMCFVGLKLGTLFQIQYGDIKLRPYKLHIFIFLNFFLVQSIRTYGGEE